MSTVTFPAAGVAKVYLQKLQSVQNMAAARMVSGVRRSEHITPVLEDLHWLPVSQAVVFNTALMDWNVFNFSKTDRVSSYRT